MVAVLACSIGWWAWGRGLLALAAGGSAREHETAGFGRLEREAWAALLGLALASALVCTVVPFSGPLTTAAARVLLGGGALAGLLLTWARPLGAPPPMPSGSSGQPGPWRGPWRPPGSGTPDAPDGPGMASSHLATLGFALATVLCLGALASAASMPVHVFDSMFHFGYKAKLIHAEGLGTGSWTDLDGPVGRVITHPNYPPGIPALAAFAGWIAGRFDQHAARALHGLFAVLPCVLIGAELARRSRAAAATGALLWIALPFLFATQLPNSLDRAKAALGMLIGPRAAQEWLPGTRGWQPADDWVLDGSGDIGVAAYALLAFLALRRLLALAERTAGEPGLAAGARSALARHALPRALAWTPVAGVALAGLMLAKNEGLALAGLLALALLFWFGARRLAGGGRPRASTLGALAGAGAVALALTASWWWVRSGLPRIDENYPQRFTPAGIAASFSNVRLVARAFAGDFADVLRWLCLWPLFFLALGRALCSPRALAASASAPALLFVLGGLVLYAAILVVTPWDLPTLFRAAIPARLMLHLAPVAVLALVELAWPAPSAASAAPAGAGT